MTPLNAHAVLQPFIDDGWISAIGHTLKGGKEATVIACRAGTRLNSSLTPAAADAGLPQAASTAPDDSRFDVGGRRREWVAAKLYRQNRSFRDASRYLEGRIILNKRTARAVANRSEFGKRAREAGWIAAEYYTLKDLAANGLDVPAPIAMAEGVMLMDFVGDDSGQAAPPLANVELAPTEAAAVLNRILGNVEAMLYRNLVHGDLSPFNVLFDEARRRPVIIDFPQAVDPRVNPHALAMLRHDVRTLAEYFAPLGVRGDFERWVTDLWRRWGGDGHHVALSALEGRAEKIATR